MQNSNEIPNTEYITMVNRPIRTICDRGWTVGDKMTNNYRDGHISWQNIIGPNETFAKWQARYPFVFALHAMTSQTKGERGKPGNPSPEHGMYIYGRLQMLDEILIPWICVGYNARSCTAASWCLEMVMCTFLYEDQFKKMINDFNNSYLGCGKQSLLMAVERYFSK